MAAWRAVKAGEGPRLTAIVAEPGMGKTRLVQEFYARLVASEQGEGPGYWSPSLAQDGNNLLVNPPEASWDVERPMPFLWWGLRLANPSGQNQVATGALAAHVEPHLVPHLEPFDRERRRRQRLIELAKVGGAVAADAVLDLIPVLGLLKKVGEVGLELKGIHDSWRADQRRLDATAASEERRTSLVEQVVSDLGKLFSGPGGASVPAVVVIDDAQFCAADKGLTAFVAALVDAMTEGAWPLLLVVTHWQREWGADSEGRSQIAELVKGHASAVPGSVEELVLAPVPDLRPVLAEALPGLSEAQSAALLGRVGGNPRYLDEMLRLAALRGRGLHVGRDPAGPLTEAGLAELLASAVDLHSAVLARLAQSPDDVQRAVVLAALQGNDFVARVVAATAEGLEEDAAAALEAVRRAQAPHAYLAETVVGAGVGSFVQPIYREVALKRLDYHYDPEAAQEALKAVVRQALRTDGVLDEAQMPAALELGAELFEHAEDQLDLQVAGHCLHLLMFRAFAAGEVHAASDLVSRQLRVLERLEDGYLDGDLRWLSGIDMLLGSLGRDDLRRPVLSRLLRLTGTGFDDDVNTWSGCLYARALLTVAEFHQLTGEHDLLLEALSLAWQVMLKTPLGAEDAWGHEEAADLGERLGELTWRSGDIPGSVAPFETALESAKALAALDPSPERERLLAVAERHLARALTMTDSDQRAAELLEHAVGRLRAISADSPSASLELASTLELQAQLYGAYGERDVAATMLEESVSLCRQLLAANPASPAARSDLADALERSADLAGDRGALEDAAEMARESVALRRAVAAQVAASLDRSELGMALVRAARFTSGEDLEEARELAREGLEYLLDTRSGLGALPDGWRRLVALEINLDLDLKAGSLLTARSLLTLADDVIAELPEGANFQAAARLAAIEGFRAQVLEAQGDGAGALLARQHKEALDALATGDE